jgi:2-desacetyl-2-hydroxyethyl bacteriochlorophyllide A dehydrogenase
MKTQGIAHVAEGRAEIVEYELRDPGPGEILVKARYTCVSPGTELRCLAGKQAGKAFPYIAGYAAVGEVIGRGPGATLADGTPVFIGGTHHAGDYALQWGGHSAYAVTEESGASVLPQGLAMLDAALAKMAAIAFRGYTLARPLAGERVAVVGLGVLGQISARLFTMSGARTVACDVSEKRVAQARAAGVEAHVVRGTLAETMAPHLPQGADIVVDVTGAPQVMAQAVVLGRDVPWDESPWVGPRYVVQGSYPADVALPYHDAFMKQMSFLLPRDNHMSDRRTAIELMAAGRLAVRDLISDIRQPSEAQHTYEQLMDRNGELVTVVFDWGK